MEQQNCLEDIMWSENPLWGGTNLFGVKNSVETFREIRASLTQQTKQKTTQKPAMTLGLWKGIFIHRHITSNLEFNSTSRKSKHSQSPLKFIDVTRTTHTKFGRYPRKPHRRLLDCWCGSKFVRLMDRIHEVHNTEKKKKKTSKRIYVVRGAPYNNSRNYQTWLLVAWNFGPACQKQLRKRESSNGRSKNQSSMMLEGWEAFISSIRKMESSRKPLKTQGKSWRYWWSRLCHVRWGRRSVPTSRGWPTTNPKVPTKTQKAKHARIVEASESTWKRLESTLPQDHEDHIAERGFNSMSHDNLVHKIDSEAPSTEHPGCESSKWDKLEKLPAWQVTKVTSQNGG